MRRRRFQKDRPLRKNKSSRWRNLYCEVTARSIIDEVRQTANIREQTARHAKRDRADEKTSVWESTPRDGRGSPRSATETETGFRNVLSNTSSTQLIQSRRRLFTSTPKVENNVNGRRLPRMKSVRYLARRLSTHHQVSLSRVCLCY
jgi:hypothetical protein